MTSTSVIVAIAVPLSGESFERIIGNLFSRPDTYNRDHCSSGSSLSVHHTEAEGKSSLSSKIELCDLKKLAGQFGHSG